MLDKNLLHETEEKIKIHINGEDILMSIYKIPVNMLHYNKYNDRILDKLHNIDKKLSLEELDNKIENYIWNDDIEGNKKTLNSIESMGQQEYGVVLEEGIVIDGNRRFTAIRKINRKENSSSSFSFFKAVILESKYSGNLKAIKSLELQIQHGREDKKGYNPVNQALAMYRDVEKEKLFTTLEYSKEIGQTIKYVEKWIGKGKLIEEFLKYINHEERYEIAIAWKLDGPMEDIYNYLKRDDNEEGKSILFDYIFVNGAKKDWKSIRKLIKSLKTNPEKVMETYEEYEKIINAVHSGLAKNIAIKDIKNNVDLNKKLDGLYEKLVNINNGEIAKEDISKKLKDINKKLEELDFDVLSEYKNNSFETDYLDFKKLIKDIFKKLYE